MGTEPERLLHCQGSILLFIVIITEISFPPMKLSTESAKVFDEENLDGSDSVADGVNDKYEDVKDKLEKGSRRKRL